MLYQLSYDGPAIGKPPQREVSHESDFSPRRNPEPFKRLPWPLPAHPRKYASRCVARSIVTASSGVFAAPPSLAGWYSTRNCAAVATMRR